MKRLIAVLLVLVGTAAMSFACVTKCRLCGNIMGYNTCKISKYDGHHINDGLNTCGSCICRRCDSKYHTTSQCDAKSDGHNVSKQGQYDKGFHAGVSGKENNCNPRQFNSRNCDDGYLDGLNALNAAKSGQYSPEE